jgi:predicted glycogen debranching enzyme
MRRPSSTSMTTRRLVDRISRQLELPSSPAERSRRLIETEWIVTNGLGGYASSSMANIITRRYHGVLVAALPNPLGRVVMLNHVGERVITKEGSVWLNDEDVFGGPLDEKTGQRILSARLEAGLPVWEYEVGGVRIEKRVMMPHRQNTVYVTYRLLDGADSTRLELVPAVHFRGYEDRVDSPHNSPSKTRYTMSLAGGVHVLSVDDDIPPLRLMIVAEGGSQRFVADECVTSEFVYPVEESRGYEFRGSLWTPGHFEIELARGQCATLVASVEDEEVMRAMSPDEAPRFENERRRRLIMASKPGAQDETGAELVIAADQFIITPAGRIADATRASALGNEIRTIIAGYHWFTDWGRDTMISLEGLTLATGRQREAAYILRTFAHYVRDGLIPNMFPDGSNEGLYHTADATLWYFHAISRYLQNSDDRATLIHLLPGLVSIIEQHIKGTRFGIGVDESDGLLRQGAEGYQLTWMDAKVDGWVVTPRRGKAVEINALWYNALRLLQGWLQDVRGEAEAAPFRERADKVFTSFNERFWIEERGYLRDVVDGKPEIADLCRPNQILAISLDNPVLDRSRWASVVDVIGKRLLTPVGLRSLAPGEPEYKPRYFGDLRSRDAAYHQGTVWGWLIGPWIDAWVKVHPDDRVGARRFLDGVIADLGEFGLGTIAEIFDAEPPFTPRGCIAQAWSVAEALRCWVKTAAPPEAATS